MKAGRLMLAALALASMAANADAQGRGGPPRRADGPRRDSIMNDQERRALTELRARHQRELQELRTRHREQMERAMPPAARERLEQRRRELMREGRMFERERAVRQRRAMPPQGGALRGPRPGARGGMAAPRRRIGPADGPVRLREGGPLPMRQRGPLPMRQRAPLPPGEPPMPPRPPTRGRGA